MSHEFEELLHAERALEGFCPNHESLIRLEEGGLCPECRQTIEVQSRDDVVLVTTTQANGIGIGAFPMINGAVLPR